MKDDAKQAWECAARLLAADTKIRGLVGAHPHETTVQAVERFIAENADDWAEVARDYGL